MYSRDGIVGTERMIPWPAEKLKAEAQAKLGAKTAKAAAKPAPAERLRKLAPGPLNDVLDFELIELLAFQADDERKAAVYCCWNETAEVERKYAPLVSIVAPELPGFAAQAELVRNYADLRTERVPEIHAQMGDIYSFFGAIDFLGPERSKWTLVLMAAAFRFAVAVEMRMKHALNCPRPVLFSPRIQPIIQTPTHGSLPSGHSTRRTRSPRC